MLRLALAGTVLCAVEQELASLPAGFTWNVGMTVLASDRVDHGDAVQPRDRERNANGDFRTGERQEREIHDLTGRIENGDARTDHKPGSGNRDNLRHAVDD